MNSDIIYSPHPVYILCKYDCTWYAYKYTRIMIFIVAQRKPSYAAWRNYTLYKT